MTQAINPEALRQHPALQTLSAAAQARVLNLALQGLKQKQIGATIGCSRAGAGTHLSAAKARLRERLAVAS